MNARVVGNFPVNPINMVEAMTYVRARALYKYPKAFIQSVTHPGTYDIQLSPTLYGQYFVPDAEQITDLWLDQYHHKLLNSVNTNDRRLGLASVIYWGFFTHGDNYARNRVQWHLNGYGAAPPTTGDRAVACTNHANVFLLAKQCGEAIGSFSGISQLGYTSFASKVVAFMAPSITGVYDKTIKNGLSNEPWAISMAKGIGRCNSLSVKNCYHSWCIYLTQVAAQLNLGIASGKPWHWSCGNDKHKLWRAIDIERAWFVKFSANDLDVHQIG